MGYYIDIVGVNITIPKKNFEPCRQALLKETPGGWVCLDKTDTLGNVLSGWRWDPEYDSSGNICNLQFNGEKYGDEDILFKAIAPYVKPGSYIRVRGEEGEHWSWDFNGKTCEENGADIDWHDNTGIVENILKRKDLLPLLLNIHPKLDEKIAQICKRKGKKK